MGADPSHIDDLPARPDFLPPGFGTVGRQAFVEIAVPEPVPYTPETPGWWALGLLVAAGLVAGAVRLVRLHRANAYRRAALEELAVLRRRAAGGDRDAAVAELPALLKRTALGAAPRASVAGLSGDPWLDWLDAAAPGALDAPSRAALGTLVVRPPQDTPRTADPALFAGAEAWVRRHRVP